MLKRIRNSKFVSKRDSLLIISYVLDSFKFNTHGAQINSQTIDGNRNVGIMSVALFHLFNTFWRSI